jgi:hypothetical protein
MLALETPPVVPIAVSRWRLATRVAFRFCVLYFGLYVATTQMLSGLIVLPVGDVPDLGELPPVRTIVSWIAAHVFHVSYPLVITGSGSGDKTFDWVHAFVVLLLAAGATTIWSLVARRGDHERLHAWFHLFVRFALGSTMVSYGAVKAIPLQMSAPGLTRLLEPFGNFSPMGVLWASIGASRSYEIFTGCAELAGGVLLFFPRTALLGALVCLADTIQIFMLNMTYDVPVKLFSFHLILMSVFLIAPDARRLANVLLLNRSAGPSTRGTLGRTPRARRAAVIAQAVFGVYLVGMNLNAARQSWTEYGGGAPKSPLYGIWNVEQMSIDGVIRSPLVTDYDRWRRVLFDRPTAMTFQRMDDTFASFPVRIDEAGKSIALTKPADKNWSARFSFDRPAPDRLILDGQMDNHRIRMELRLVDRNKLLLVSRGFHWIQEYPFNR